MCSKGYGLLKKHLNSTLTKITFYWYVQGPCLHLQKTAYIKAWPCEMPHVARETEKQTWNQSQGWEVNESGERMPKEQGTAYQICFACPQIF